MHVIVLQGRRHRGARGGAVAPPSRKSQPPLSGNFGGVRRGICTLNPNPHPKFLIYFVRPWRAVRSRSALSSEGSRKALGTPRKRAKVSVRRIRHEGKFLCFRRENVGRRGNFVGSSGKFRRGKKKFRLGKFCQPPRRGPPAPPSGKSSRHLW